VFWVPFDVVEDYCAVITGVFYSKEYQKKEREGAKSLEGASAMLPSVAPTLGPTAAPSKADDDDDDGDGGDGGDGGDDDGGNNADDVLAVDDVVEGDGGDGSGVAPLVFEDYLDLFTDDHDAGSQDLPAVSLSGDGGSESSGAAASSDSGIGEPAGGDESAEDTAEDTSFGPLIGSPVGV
jgi:hypothetical protein